VKIYLSGPMSGMSAFNIPTFDKAATKLRALGHEVVSPAELDSPEFRELCLKCTSGSADQIDAWCKSRILHTPTWGELTARDLQIIVDDGIDAIVVLPGWEHSRGARLETFVARLCEIPVLDYPALCKVHAGQLQHAHGVHRTDGTLPPDSPDVTGFLKPSDAKFRVAYEDLLPEPFAARLKSRMQESDEKGPLERAAPLVHGDRQKDYGHPAEDFKRTAGMWESAFGWKVAPSDVPLAMIMVKLSRLRQSPDHEDSATDIAGYIACYEMTRKYSCPI